MEKIKFSRGALKFALTNNISEKDLLKNYRTILPDYYQIGEDIMLEKELPQFVIKNRLREEFFWDRAVKEKFWLIMDTYFVDELSGKGKLSEIENVEEITEDSTGKEIYWFLKNKLRDFDESWFKETRDRHIGKRFSPQGFFEDVLSSIGVPKKLHEKVHESFEYYQQFYYAEDEFLDN